MITQSLSIQVVPSPNDENKYLVTAMNQRWTDDKNKVIDPYFKTDLFEHQAEVADDDLLRWNITVLRRVLRIMEEELAGSEGGWNSGTCASPVRASETLTEE